MTTQWSEIQVKGKPVKVASVCLEGRTVVVKGRRLKIAAIFDEELTETDAISDPEHFIDGLKRTGLGADVFTFTERLPDTEARHRYHLEWDSLAVIPITTYKDWEEKRVEYDVRKAIRRARRDGVDVKVVSFDDGFVRGIQGIYNETPVRQGRSFWHFGKDFETVRRENSTYLDRSEYIGAYVNQELVGFIRMVYVRDAALTLQVISQRSQFSKKPTSALIAKAVEVCAAKGLSHFVYGSYLYNDITSSLTEFKRRHGFEELRLPRYYAPLTPQGRLALALKLHRPLANRIPAPVRAQLRQIRNSLWEKWATPVTANTK
jgi:hypothetical protein